MEEPLNVKTDAFIFKDESVHICGFQLSDNCFRINAKEKKVHTGKLNTPTIWSETLKRQMFKPLQTMLFGKASYVECHIKVPTRSNLGSRV